MDEVVEQTDVWDATTASWVAQCPRLAEGRILYNLRSAEEAYAATAGKALHAALALYYTDGDLDACLLELARVWGHDADWRLPPTHRWAHLHLGHLEVVFRNYVAYAARHDTFKPLPVKREDLQLDQVIAGIWQVTDDGHVVLGESKFMMEFEIELPDGSTTRITHSGKPDLPIEMGGSIYILDHKTTSSYLSDWYFAKFKFSNQLRGYCAMLKALTGLPVGGALINGVYVGAKASDSKFTGGKVARYGPMNYQPAHLTEALQNQYFWREQLMHHYAQGYFPQNAGQACTSCDLQSLCAASPSMRETVMRTDYTVSPKNVAETFLTL
jgi:hypothetical protein